MSYVFEMLCFIIFVLSNTLNMDYPLYQWWAMEREDARENQFHPDTKFIIHEERLFTPFSNSYQTLKQAKDFMKKKGDFWKHRGVHLELFIGKKHIDKWQESV